MSMTSIRNHLLVLLTLATFIYGQDWYRAAAQELTPTVETPTPIPYAPTILFRRQWVKAGSNRVKFSILDAQSSPAYVNIVISRKGRIVRNATITYQLTDGLTRRIGIPDFAFREGAHSVCLIAQDGKGAATSPLCRRVTGRAER